MDEEYIEAVARLLAAEANAQPRVCERCGGGDMIVAAVPVDPDLGTACLPVAYCRTCDATAPEAAGMFAAFDEVKGRKARRPEDLSD
jgi:hypothetical protein